MCLFFFFFVVTVHHCCYINKCTKGLEFKSALFLFLQKQLYRRQHNPIAWSKACLWARFQEFSLYDRNIMTLLSLGLFSVVQGRTPVSSERSCKHPAFLCFYALGVSLGMTTLSFQTWKCVLQMCSENYRVLYIVKTG